MLSNISTANHGPVRLDLGEYGHWIEQAAIRRTRQDLRGREDSAHENFATSQSSPHLLHPLPDFTCGELGCPRVSFRRFVGR